MEQRSAIFHPRALEAIRSFPKSVRRELGQAILDLQLGTQPGMPLCRPMPSVAPGAAELRVRDSSGSYRAFFTLKWRGGVLIFHAFEKRTAKTPKREIDVAIRRLREMMKSGDGR
jgi:phage-related protein